MKFMSKEQARANGLDKIITEEELMKENNGIDINGEEIRLTRDIIGTMIEKSEYMQFLNKKKGLRDLKLAIEDVFEILAFDV